MKQLEFDFVEIVEWQQHVHEIMEHWAWDVILKALLDKRPSLV